MGYFRRNHEGIVMGHLQALAIRIPEWYCLCITLGTRHTVYFSSSIFLSGVLGNTPPYTPPMMVAMSPAAGEFSPFLLVAYPSVDDKDILLACKGIGSSYLSRICANTSATETLKGVLP
ncbi:hypothetical protein LIER_28619 [Lithospermum erythrorhizon]|uniref:Uncharacterized protein n=1 Tax=Lithospermum erythrorhizon TaxID=34254 RepID=A0AAV3RHW6_LITER